MEGRRKQREESAKLEFEKMKLLSSLFMGEKWFYVFQRVTVPY